uniref:Ras-related protein Rab n=1 Tax=Angiostrongylus cantonensis TaxID=6313 RepID=A0A158PC82_ANGCA
LSAIRDHENEVEVAITQPKTRVKVVIVGSSGVGKTSLIYRHRYGSLSGPYTSTIGASFVECENITLQIWDTAGQERFRCMVPMYMRNSAAAIIMYDVTNWQSFKDVDKWSEGLFHTFAFFIRSIKPLHCDLCDGRCVSTAEGRRKAREIDARYYEVTLEKPISKPIFVVLCKLI